MARGRLILDSGALSALAQGEPRVRAWLTVATKRQMLVGIPTPVLTECVTGRPQDASVYRVIPAGDAIIATTMEIAVRAGALRFRATGSASAVDAIVVSTAAHVGRSIILTSDPIDLQSLADCITDAAPTVVSVNDVPPSRA